MSCASHVRNVDDSEISTSAIFKIRSLILNEGNERIFDSMLSHY